MRTRITIMLVGALCGAVAGVMTKAPETRVIPPTPVRPASTDVAEWYLYLAGQRARHLALLEEYCDQGRFPMNQDRRLGMTPLFVDHRGTSCAVAHLMLKDGLGPVVREISKARNQVRVMEVKEGPLVDWIAASGLTQEECALIQPGYDPLDGRRQQERVRRHLRGVLTTLRQDTHRSLEIACRRLLPSRGFVLERPGYTERLIELKAPGTLEVRVTLLDVDGSLYKPGTWCRLDETSRVFPWNSESPNCWWLVEWRGGEEVEATRPAITVRG